MRDVALAAVSTTSRADAKTVVTALRVWLRFLASRGACPAGLGEAIPRVPQWRYAGAAALSAAGSSPRAGHGSCDLRTVHGLRDRAILLLLARLGLRAGDVLLLRLDNLDWGAATLRVRGKGRRDVHLPLPQDVGDAVLAYLAVRRDDGGGGSGPEPRVFLRAGAPRRPFADSSTSISSIVRLALERAGIADPPTRGANLLRHSAATSLPPGRASLDEISALLRHRSLDTTAHYAKVDVPCCSTWPGPGRRARHAERGRRALRRPAPLPRLPVPHPSRPARSSTRGSREARGDRAIRTATALAWAGEAPSPQQRRNRLLVLRRLALALRAEDGRSTRCPRPTRSAVPVAERHLPHIYGDGEVTLLLRAAAGLAPAGGLQPILYAWLCP